MTLDYCRERTRYPLYTLICFGLISLFAAAALSQELKKIPEELESWKDWATWDIEHRDCPTPYNDASVPMCFWPSQLELSAGSDGAAWSATVQVYERTWIPLPGTADLWPVDVQVGDETVVVVARDGRPSVELGPGTQKIDGKFAWQVMPQKITIPQQIGILSLEVNGSRIATPNWDAGGELWLRRQQSDQTAKDLLNVQVYRVIGDGIPMWLTTQIDLTVSGKSREEELGWSLPEGWQISTVESKIPVAIDDRGLLKAQVRAGKWTVVINAFRTTDPDTIQFASDADPISGTELIGLRTNPEFRVSQLEGLDQVDASQTSFPSGWRDVSVFRWDTSQSFSLIEKTRGMGEQKPKGLQIQRRLWLDDDGRGFTFRDQIRGQMQQIWRLDVADEHELGAVRIDGESQLITENPQTGSSGVEVRRRDLNMDAIGRLEFADELSATGWQRNAESLGVQLTLPPGYRVLAIFGDNINVRGDWLTAWSLLDLFLLLVFSFAVLRMFGIIASLVALLAFGLSYHEPAAPHFTWLLVLMPLALLRFVDSGAGRKWLLAWKSVAIVMLLLALVPFIAMQTQSAIYPQLEPQGSLYGERSVMDWPVATYSNRAQMVAASGRTQPAKPRSSKFDTSNLKFDPRSRIQTGPAQPQWDWNNVYCTWNGPVSADKTITPILISRTQHRVLTVVRVALLMLLAAIILGGAKIRLPFSKRAVGAAMLLGLLVLPSNAQAQIPDRETLDLLRKRLLVTPDVFPNAAEIPSAKLTIRGNNIEVETKIHAAVDVAVPLPGRLPAWSPVSVRLDGDADVVVSRRDGYLWILVPQGIHEVIVEGLIPDESDWEWTFVLKPKYVTVDAAGWTVTGIDRDGVPDPQIFLAREAEITDDRLAYDRREFNAVVVIDRYLEIGLDSKLRSTVTRLSSGNKALSLVVPLLDGESVLTTNREVEDGSIAVRMSVNQKSFSWESELPAGADISLQAAQSDRWVERWHLATSPIWNVEFQGLNPIFEAEERDLIPVWNPWPGETVTLTFSKPTAVVGETMTIQHVQHQTKLSSGLQTGSLVVDLESSLANDLVMDLASEAEILSVKRDETKIPPQRDGTQLIVPTKPGRQKITVEWENPEPMETLASVSPVKLPVPASNVTSVIVMPEERWVLWAEGPMRGPAVRFWTILAVAVLIALALGSLPLSPLRRLEWVLLAIGLTQVHLVPAMLVVGWLFLLAWRGRIPESTEGRWGFNLMQLFLIGLTFIALGVLVMVVREGLLGNPRMFIVGNGSHRMYLQWFQPRVGTDLPVVTVVSISVWFYRLLMLFWALWLASALLRWLIWGWKQFTHGGAWRRAPGPILATEVQGAAVQGNNEEYVVELEETDESEDNLS